MTFEEWKEKHSDLIENVAITFFNYERGVDTKTCYDELEYLLKRAFNEGRPKWHDLRKNPTDVPREEGEYLVCYETEGTNYRDTFILKYEEYDESLHWCDETFETFDEGVIAWCEKPQYAEG